MDFDFRRLSACGSGRSRTAVLCFRLGRRGINNSRRRSDGQWPNIPRAPNWRAWLLARTGHAIARWSCLTFGIGMDIVAMHIVAANIFATDIIRF